MDLLDPGIKLGFPALQASSLPTELLGKPLTPKPMCLYILLTLHFRIFQIWCFKDGREKIFKDNFTKKLVLVLRSRRVDWRIVRHRSWGLFCRQLEIHEPHMRAEMWRCLGTKSLIRVAIKVLKFQLQIRKARCYKRKG